MRSVTAASADSRGSGSFSGTCSPRRTVGATLPRKLSATLYASAKNRPVNPPASSDDARSVQNPRSVYPLGCSWSGSRHASSTVEEWLQLRYANRSNTSPDSAARPLILSLQIKSLISRISGIDALNNQLLRLNNRQILPDRAATDW